MVRARAVTIATVWVMSLSAVSANAHVNATRVFPVYELPAAELPDVHDGSLEDWDDVAFHSVDHNDLVLTAGAESDPADLAWRMFAAWNAAEQRMYVGMEFLDDDLTTPPPADENWAERVNVFIDADHSGGSYAIPVGDVDVGRVTRAQGYEFGLSWGESVDAFVHRWIEGTRNLWALYPPWTYVQVTSEGVSPSHSVLEAILTPWDEQGVTPEESRRSELRAGRIIGLQVRIMDYDDGGLQSAFLLGSSEDYFISASGFVDAILIPCEAPGCSGRETAVIRNSWARIKMGL